MAKIPTSVNQPRGVKEDLFDVKIPDRHCGTDGEGTTKHGDSVHGTYKQPWVEHDPVKPEDPKIG